MKSKAGTPVTRRLKDGSRPNAIGNSATKKNLNLRKDISMTPDTFERSKSRLKKRTARQRHSFNETYDGDITQLMGNDTYNESMMDTDGELTPATLSQISAINPNENDTFTTTFARKRSHKAMADETWEMAVEYARGEPDGAERSFTRKTFSKMSLKDGDVNSKENKEDNEMEVDEVHTPSPAKRSKVKDDKMKTPTSKKAGSLKIPLKEAAKKMKSMKNPIELKKTKKEVNKNFEALPDETTVPKTPNQTWKEKKKERKMLKNNYDLITSAKVAWEDLRRADLSDEKRKKICTDLMRMVRGKVKELALVHDSSRVLQCLVQYGSDEQRQVIFDEIKDDIVEICKMKYSKFLVRKFIHYGSKSLRAEVFKRFYGHARKLMRHKEASEILEYAYNDYATAPQRLAIQEEFYGSSYALFKQDHAPRSLQQILTDMPDKKEIILRNMKEAISPLIQKELVIHSLAHKLFSDFLSYANETAKKDIIEGLRDLIPHLLHTRDGTRAAMHCVWSGSTKDRKAIVKSLKTHVVKVCKDENGHLLMLSVFDNIDDTVLVQKVIIDELMKSLDEIVKDQHGRKVLLYLLNPRDSAHFHPDIIKILSEGDNNAHSKKDKLVRAKELRGHASPGLLKYIEENAEPMMTNSNLALLTKSVMTFAVGDAGPAMRAIADFIAKPSTDEAISMVEHPACHIAMKKIIAHDKVRMDQGEGILFSAILLEALPKSTIKVWAASNRGCFVLLSLLQVGCSTVTERVTEKLKPLRKSLNKMTFKGAELLLQNLDSPNTIMKKEFRV